MVRVTASILAVVLLAACSEAPVEDDGPAAGEAAQAPAAPAPGSPEAKIANATSAAPAAIAANATVMDWPSAEGAEMTELRPGTNGWTCMPDVPTTPGNDPMCLDPTFLAWAGAWQSRAEPELPGVGLAYMLQGGSDASNTDPHASGPAAGEAWVESGPHVMVVVPDVAMLEGIPTDHAAGGPYVMWKGTPWAHIMMPVR